MREGFDYRWLDFFLDELQKISPKQKYVVTRTVFLDDSDKLVARRLSLSRQRISNLRRQGLNNLKILLDKYCLDKELPL